MTQTKVTPLFTGFKVYFFEVVKLKTAPRIFLDK